MERDTVADRSFGLDVADMLLSFRSHTYCDKQIASNERACARGLRPRPSALVCSGRNIGSSAQH
eukprot:scaffold191111_cov34-Tisochrysis_lutea.AAC.1